MFIITRWERIKIRCGILAWQGVDAREITPRLLFLMAD
jgi:hypothetical protein